MVPRYVAYGHQGIDWLWQLESLSLYFFQSSGETNPAVIAFITISGYCIHRNGLRSYDMRVWHFFIRRVFRIVPILLVGISLGIFIFQATPHSEMFLLITNTKSINMSAVLYKIAGIFTLTPYRFEHFAQLGNGPLITCILELWLYALYPVGLFVIYQMGARVWLIMLALLHISSLALCYSNGDLINWWYNGSLQAFLLYWWIGAFGNNTASGTFHAVLRKVKYSGLLYVMLCCILTFYPSQHWLVAVKHLILSMFVVGVLLECEGGAKDFKIHNLMNCGYAVYAIHLPIICLCLVYNVPFVITLFMIIAIGYILHRYFEKPLLAFGTRYLAKIEDNNIMVQAS